MATKDYKTRSGHPVDDPETLLRWLDLLPPAMNTDALAAITPALADKLRLFDASAGVHGSVTLTALQTLIGGLRGTFSAYRSGNQTGLTAGAYNKVSLNAENFDIDSWFDSTTNFRFTPLVAGKYFFCANGSANDTVTDTPQASIYKNGSRAIYGSYYGGVGSTGFNVTSVCSGIVDMNGSSDYVELYVYLPATITQVNGSSNDFTTMSGFRISA